MTKKPIIFFTLLILISIAIIAALDLEEDTSQENAEPHKITIQLPTWQAGDSWTYTRSGIENFSIQVTEISEAVTGQGTENWYVLEGSCTPPYSGWGENLRLSFTVNSLDLRQKQVWGYANSTFHEKAWTYSYDNYSQWPKTENKEQPIKYEVSLDETTGISGETSDEGTHQRTITVIGIENITVPAGKFKAIKINVSEAGSLVETIWYSSKAKNIVKLNVRGGPNVNSNYSFSPTGENFELSTYEVS